MTEKKNSENVSRNQSVIISWSSTVQLGRADRVERRPLFAWRSRPACLAIRWPLLGRLIQKFTLAWGAGWRPGTTYLLHGWATASQCSVNMKCNTTVERHRR